MIQFFSSIFFRWVFHQLDDFDFFKFNLHPEKIGVSSAQVWKTHNFVPNMFGVNMNQSHWKLETNQIKTQFFNTTCLALFSDKTTESCCKKSPVCRDFQETWKKKQVFWGPKLIPICKLSRMIFYDFSRFFVQNVFCHRTLSKILANARKKLNKLGSKKRSRIKIIWKKSPEA